MFLLTISNKTYTCAEFHDPTILKLYTETEEKDDQFNFNYQDSNYLESIHFPSVTFHPL